MNGVVAKVDLRALPMSIAESMLGLGKALNMGQGPVAFLEAEFKLEIWLQVLVDYRQMFFDLPMSMSHHKKSVIRFIQLHECNPNLKATQARQLLDMFAYFPSAENVHPYEENLDADERRGD